VAEWVKDLTADKTVGFRTLVMCRSKKVATLKRRSGVQTVLSVEFWIREKTKVKKYCTSSETAEMEMGRTEFFVSKSTASGFHMRIPKGG